MRRLWTVVAVHAMALALFVGGGQDANAFGAEVLGCSVVGGSWTANTCSGTGRSGDGLGIQYWPQNLSGTYTTSWTVTSALGRAITTPCSTTVTTDCVYQGCTADSTSCTVVGRVGFGDQRYTATLRLTQAGLTRTIQASAVLHSGTVRAPAG